MPEDPRLNRDGGLVRAERCKLEVDQKKVKEVDDYWKQKEIESYLEDDGKVIIEEDDGYCD